MNYEPSRIQPQRRQVQVQKENGSDASQSTKRSRISKKESVKAGAIFGRLTAIKYIGLDKNNHPIWKFQCSCGVEKSILLYNVIRGLTNSCGCFRRENTTRLKTIHGKRYTPEHGIWCGIKRRCLNERDVQFANYGGRGISMYPDWIVSFESFFQYVGPRPSKNHSIDRIDNNGNYEPGNVRWATPIEQANNTRFNRLITVKGITKTIAQWESEMGCRKEMIRQRINRLGWNPEVAIFTPKKYDYTK